MDGHALALGFAGGLAVAGASRRGAQSREIWFHRSPRKNQESIRAHGLKLDRAFRDGFTPEGIYLTEFPPPPEAGSDTWEVDVTGFVLHPDPFCGEEAARGACVYVTQDIPAGRVALWLPQGTRMHHEIWGEAVVVGRHDARSWEVKNRKGHSPIPDREIPEWRVEEGSRAWASRQEIRAADQAFFKALEEEAGPKQVLYMGPFAFVGDRAGDILGKLEISVRQDSAEGGARVHLAYLGVDIDRRQRGFGRRLLQIVCQAADRVGLPIDLDVSPQKSRGERRPPMNKAQLRAFYETFGFKRVKGMGPDYMVRPPHAQNAGSRAVSPPSAGTLNEWLWQTYGDGQLRRFDELPLTHQRALAMESMDFEWYGDLAAAQRRYEHGLNDLPGGVRFKVFRVPASVMTSAIWQGSPELREDHASFKAYHDWYTKRFLKGKEGSRRTEDWPVILHDHPGYGELLWDGWHRLHTYLKLKRKDIPCMLPVWPEIPTRRARRSK